MRAETELLIEKNKLDCELQHLKYYQEGYRHSVLNIVYGEIKVGDELDIETHKYSPDGARDVSYKEGWNKAIEHHNL